jgi:hypothetical protein
VTDQHPAVSEPGLTARLNEANRRVFDHPAAREHREIQALQRMLHAVFVPNWWELLQLLNAAAKDEALAVELVQNVRRPDVRERFQDQTTQRLHNYVAATMTIVDHVRRLIRDRTTPTATEFGRRRQQVAAELEIPFMKDLRNFTLHRTLPGFSHQLRVLDPPEQGVISIVGLSVTQLMEWDGWTSPSAAFIRSQPETFELLPIVQRHGRLIIELNGWLCNELIKDNAEGLADVDRLVVERNAVLMGGNLEQAARMTAAWTALRQNPAPISTEEFMKSLATMAADPTESTGTESDGKSE